MSLQQEEKARTGPEGDDARVLDYITQNKGTLRWGQAVNDLNMTRDEIETSIKKLMEDHFLKGNETSHYEDPVAGTHPSECEHDSTGRATSAYEMGNVKSSRMYGCEKCGSPISAYPPDDVHTVAAGRSSPLLQTIDIRYVCHNCGEVKYLHWRRPIPVSFPFIISTYLRKNVFSLVHRSVSDVIGNSIRPRRKMRSKANED